MKISTKKTITEEREYVTDVLCNKCGKSCVPVHRPLSCDAPKWACGLVETTIHGKFLSPVLEDLTSYTFSICELCVQQLFESFIIPPTKNDHEGLI